MAKGLPYFKFTPTEWLTGDITFEELNVQGLFINICALYWQRDGVLSLEDIIRRYKREDLIKELSGRFFSVSDGFISVKFLDEQLLERKHLITQNKINGEKGGRPKATPPLEEKPTANPPLSDGKPKLTNIEEEEELRRRREEEKNKRNSEFEIFWNVYDKKVDSKKCKHKFIQLSQADIEKILKTIHPYVRANPDRQFRKNPLTYLNGNCWNDEIIFKSPQNGTNNVTQQVQIYKPPIPQPKKETREEIEARLLKEMENERNN